jgi:hypothetical protein
MRAVLLAGLLVLAWPAVAAYAVDYGGGTPADSVERAQRQLTIVGIRLGANLQARVWVTVAARCGTGPATAPVTLNSDGTFAFRRTLRDRIPNGARRTTRIRMAGQIVGNAASGTVSARLSFRRHGRVTGKCSSGTRTWQARLSHPLGAPSPARPNAGYYGSTSQEGGRVWPITVKVSENGRRVSTAVFEYRHRCRSGNVYEFNNLTPGAPIAADGTFHLRERFTIHYAEGNERYRVSVDGQFQADGLTGTLSVRSVLKSRGGGRVLDRCTTGAHTSWAATF